MNREVSQRGEKLDHSAAARETEKARPSAGKPVTSHEQRYAGLLPILTRLDQRLTAAVKSAEYMFAARAAGDLYRGLAISPADVAAAFGRVPGEPFLPLSLQAFNIAEATNSLSLRRLLWLRDMYGLNDFDVDIILIGLAPEIDLRYERLYAYLQDDVTRRRPGIDLALNLLCSSAGEKLQQRERFAPDAPLLHHRLIDIFADPHYQNPPLLGRFFRLDEQIVRYLLLDDSMDARLIGICRMVNPTEYQNDALLTDEMRQRLLDLAANQPESLIRLSFEGPAGCGQAEAVVLLATTLGLQVLEVDIGQCTTSVPLTDDKLRTMVHEAWLRGVLLHVKGIDSQSNASGDKALDTLWLTLRTMPIPFVIETQFAWVATTGKPRGVVSLGFSTPATAQRHYWWHQCLSQDEVAVDDDVIAMLAQRYRLTFSQIHDAAKAGAMAQWSVGSVTDKDALIGNCLSSSAKALTRHLLAKLALHIESRRDWQDLVVPEDTASQLRELCAQSIHREKVLEGWGFGRKVSYGKGINVLFVGPSGTGKTMAAEIIANELGLDLYKIDLASVVSKYIGETEKNLDKIFTTAEHANAILLFDEADAIFGRRSEVKDAHDRYANLEISYLLQKMEQYEGIAILATNLRQNLDEAFVRRLAFIVQFPFPDETMRRRIWGGIWPASVPLANDVDLDALAKQMKLSGGSIRNVALSAAFLAAGDGQIVTLEHVQRAAQREFQKLGKPLALATNTQVGDTP
jgi:hypothetical protein